MGAAAAQRLMLRWGRLVALHISCVPVRPVYSGNKDEKSTGFSGNKDHQIAHFKEPPFSRGAWHHIILR